MMSSAAPSFSPAMMPSPVLALAADRPFGSDRCALILHPHLLVVLEPTGTEDRPATSPDQFLLSGFRRIGIADVDGFQ
jgi:hypothetical protein